MICPQCGHRTTRAKQGYKSHTNSTEIEKIDIHACTNKDCPLYAGTDLSNPEHVANREVEILESVDF